MSTLLKAAQLLSEPANETINLVIDRVGLGSMAAGVGVKVAEKAEVIEIGLAITDYAAMIAIVGGILYCVKMTLEIVYGHERRKAERAKEDQQAN